MCVQIERGESANEQFMNERERERVRERGKEGGRELESRI